MNSGGDHQRVEFRTAVDSLPTGFPPAIARRGVPRSMWEQDMSHIRAMSEKLARDERREGLLLLFTCGISICIQVCLGGGVLDHYNSDLRAYVNSMNSRYTPFGVTWETQWVPYSGTYMSYET